MQINIMKMMREMLLKLKNSDDLSISQIPKQKINAVQV
jgi:hypothetical protein